MSASQTAIRAPGRSSIPGGRFRAVLISAAAAVVALLGVAAPLRAQFKEMNEYVNAEGRTEDLTTFKADHPRKMTQLQGTILPVITTGKINSPAEAAALEKLAWLHIAELTWPYRDATQSIEQRRNLTKARWLARQIGATDNNQVPEAHDKVNSVLLKGLPTIIAEPQYSLVTRYNALVLLGQLDKSEPDSLKSKLAVPLAEALPLLVKAYQEPTMGETLRIAALIGIERHCGLQPAAADRVIIAGELLKLLQEKAPPAGWSTDGFHWTRKLALQSVASLGLAGASEVNKPEFVVAIHQILADDKQPLMLRREACAAIAALPAATLGASPVKPNELVKGIANFTHTVLKAGSPRVDPTAPLDLSKAEDVLPTPVEGPGFNLPGVRQLDLSTPPKKLFADAVLYYLNNISAALGGRDAGHGVLRIAGLDNTVQQSADGLLKDHINPLIPLLAKSPTQLAANKLVSDMTGARSKLEAWMQGRAMLAGAGGAAAAPAGDPAGILGAPQAPPPPRQ